MDLKVITRENPHVVALQEADGPSFWSGKFNHVDYLARTGGYSYYLQLDPLSDRIRREQIDEFIHAMSDRNRPLIVAELSTIEFTTKLENRSSG